MSIRTLGKKFIGDRAFYTMVLTIAVPMIIQNAITNFVGLLDNIMIGQVGTEPMTGASIANQLMFVYILFLFGGLSGAGIFTAQFHGKGDPQGIRYTLRFKMILTIIITAAALLIFLLADTPLIEMFLHEGSATGDLAATLEYARQYLRVMLVGLLPWALSQIYSSTLREVGETRLPMLAGIIAVFANLFLNWVLIYGHFGLPAMGVVGAAIATVISRFLECAIVMVWSHKHKEKFPFFQGAWKSLRVPLSLTKDMLVKGLPLVVNEGLWSLSMTAITQCYSVRGLAVVAGLNIASTIINLFNVIFMSLGNAVGIIVGKLLGQGSTDEAIDTDRKLIFFGAASCVFVGGIMAALSPLFPMLYNTTEEVRLLAASFICVAGILMPMHGCLHCCYFTLRTGGKTMMTMVVDCGFDCVISFPAAWLMANLTGLDIIPLYLTVQLLSLIKCLIFVVLVKKKVWVNNIVGGTME